jgi:hypothetical protein
MSDNLKWLAGRKRSVRTDETLQRVEEAVW